MPFMGIVGVPGIFELHHLRHSQDLRPVLALQKVPIRIHGEEHSCKKVSLVSCVSKLMIAQLLRGHAIIQNAS